MWNLRQWTRWKRTSCGWRSTLMQFGNGSLRLSQWKKKGWIKCKISNKTATPNTKRRGWHTMDSNWEMKWAVWRSSLIKFVATYITVILLVEIYLQLFWQNLVYRSWKVHCLKGTRITKFQNKVELPCELWSTCLDVDLNEKEFLLENVYFKAWSPSM